jgi:transposase-like protein
MTDNTTLDAAIDAADHKVKERYDQKQKRRHARALIAKLLEGMEKPEWFTTDEDCGWDAAISDLRLRVGLEYEV